MGEKRLGPSWETRGSSRSRDASASRQAIAAASVSVIIPCWNAEKWIARAIQSVLDQDYPNLNLVVVDDGSSDRSLEIVRTFGDKLTWVTGPKTGAPSARNKGLDLSDSEFVLFLDADDYLEGPLITGLVSAATAEDADLALGSTVREASDGWRSARTGCAERMTNPELVRAWLDGSYVQTGGQLWRRAFLNQIGAWDPRVAKLQDLEIAMRALIAGAKVAVSNRGVAIWFHHDDPHRISLQSNRGTFASTVEFLYRHGRAAQSRYPGLELAFARSLYGFAREALAIGCHDVGVDAITKARALGLRGHPGSPRRARICRMIGFVPAEYMVIGVRLTRTTLKRFRQRLLARPKAVAAAPT